MDVTALMVLFGLLTLAVDGLLWGFAGNILFRYMGGNQDKWPVGAFFVWLAYFVYDEILMTNIMSNLGVSFENQEVTDFLGEDWLTFDLFDLATSIAVIFVGFKITQQIIYKVFFKYQNKKVQ